MPSSPPTSASAQTEPAAFRRLLTRAILLPLILMFMLAGVFLWQINRLLRAAELVDHTDQVIAQANRTQSLLVDMETGMRGYLIAGNPLFLEPYNRASDEIEPAFARLSSLVADNPAQVEHVAVARGIYTEWAQFSRNVIMLRNNGGDYASPVSAGLGKTRMDAMRVQLASFIEAEQALRDERAQATRHATRIAVSTSLALTLLLGGLLAYVAWQQLTRLSHTYEQALTDVGEREEQLRRAVTRSPYPVIIHDEDDRILAMSQGWTHYSGYTPADLPTIGDWTKHAYGERSSLVKEYIDRLFEIDESMSNGEWEINAKDGTKRVWDFWSTSLGSLPNGRRLLLSNAVDVTERKRTEAERESLLQREQTARRQAEEASRLKDEFLATVSHELRTPLTAVLGWARLLQTDGLDEPTARRALDTIERNARAQAQLIEDLLDVSRVISGKLRLDVRPVELAPVIAAVADAVQPAADAKGITLRTDIDGAAPAVLGDAARLQQVIWNLLANAIKFTPGGGEVRIALARRGTHGELLISDTGEGIAPEFLPHAFERFRQADGSPTRAHGGLGLGLAIVRHLVELHGGAVSVASDGAGRGTTFTVQLPSLPDTDGAAVDARTTQASAADDQPPSLTAPQADAPLTGLHVLLVEDEPDARELLRLALARGGARVTTADSVAEALAVLAQETPDLLLSDIGMHESDGYMLIREVRALEARLGRSRLPAVALTAYARPEDRAQALSAGFHTHLTKPVEPAALIAALANLLGRA